MAHAPKNGMAMLSKNMALTTAGCLANPGVDEKHISKVGNITFSKSTQKNLLHNLGADIICLTSEQIKNKETLLICNKGEDSSNAASFFKLLCWYDKQKDIVEILCFVIENAGNKSYDAAKFIYHV